MFVDADSCPVKSEIVEIASLFSAAVILVASYDHYLKEEYTYARWKYVDAGKEAVDLFIMNHAGQGDIVVTQDIGLASTLLPTGVQVLSPKGFMFREEEIQTALDIRFLHAKARRRGVFGKGPKPFQEKDRQRFKTELTRILSNFTEIL
ncbi:YaiI/YqxD family protein [Neobacillus thermocopriae]|nr:YaiI/YqxD family protein [Neobacillus thermocopriae]MED3715499.1 YaiI/YqxD family protein [Neobacillus thermocopriae]